MTVVSIIRYSPAGTTRAPARAAAADAGGDGKGARFYV